MTLKEFWESKNGCNIEYKNKKFKGAYYGKELNLWYDNGNTSIPLQGISQLKELESRCDEYVNGNVLCVRCLKAMKAENYSQYRRWFAAVICNDCWTKKDEENRRDDYSRLD